MGLGQNGPLSAEEIFKCIFLNERYGIFIILLKFVPEGQIDNNSVLLKVIIWSLFDYWSRSLTLYIATID